MFCKSNNNRRFFTIAVNEVTDDADDSDDSDVSDDRGDSDDHKTPA